MPTFDQKFPDVPVDFESPPREGDVFKIATSEPCWLCKQPTTWYSFTWVAPVCSTECDKKAIDEYVEATHRAIRDDNGVTEMLNILDEDSKK